MNNLVKAETHVPATQGDPYAAYGATVGTDTPFLKFVKGQFKYGADDEVLPLGTQLVPNMGELKSGFIKWKDGAPEAEVMVPRVIFPHNFISRGKPCPYPQVPRLLPNCME